MSDIRALLAECRDIEKWVQGKNLLTQSLLILIINVLLGVQCLATVGSSSAFYWTDTGNTYIYSSQIQVTHILIVVIYR